MTVTIKQNKTTKCKDKINLWDVADGKELMIQLEKYDTWNHATKTVDIVLTKKMALELIAELQEFVK